MAEKSGTAGGRTAAGNATADTESATVRPFPDREADGDGLTQRQRRILEFIRDSVERRGFPPWSARSARPWVCRSASSVAHQLSVLQRKGCCGGTPTGRAPSTSGCPATPALEPRPRSAAGAERRGPAPTYVPVLGRIAAGGPILAEQAVEDVFPLPRELVGEGTLFLLQVVGDSMVDAAICDGDWVVVRQQPTAKNGEIVAAMLDGEATVKTYSGATGTSG